MLSPWRTEVIESLWVIGHQYHRDRWGKKARPKPITHIKAYRQCKIDIFSVMNTKDNASLKKSLISEEISTNCAKTTRVNGFIREICLCLLFSLPQLCYFLGFIASRKNFAFERVCEIFVIKKLNKKIILEAAHGIMFVSFLIAIKYSEMWL